MEVKKVAKKWEIWNEEEETAKSEEEAKKLVSQRFHKQIYVFGKKASERMPIKGKREERYVSLLKNN